MLVGLLHVTIISAFLFYVGLRRNKLAPALFPVVLSVGAVVILYHSYKMVVKGMLSWINLIHVVLVGPLLVYIGYMRETTPRKYFELCLMLAFAAFGYHTFYLLQ